MDSQKLFSNRSLLNLVIPLILEQFLAVTVGMADSMMVASVSEAAVSGVSLVDSVNILLINIFAALATGGAVVSGQYLGMKKKEKASIAADQLVLFVLIISLGIMALMYLGKEFILTGVFGRIDQEVYYHANRYLLVVTASIPFIALYNSGAALYRSMGDSKTSLRISLVVNIVNVIGNAILIYGFHLGVVGAAIPTLVSRALGAFIVLIKLRDQNLLIHLAVPFKLKLDGKMIKKILHIGVPSGIENSLFQLGKIMLLSLVTGFGTSAIAANSIAGTLSNFHILPASAIGLALITVVSRCVGASDYQQARYYTKKLMIAAYISMTFASLLLFFLLPLLLKVYNLSPETTTLTYNISSSHIFASILIWPAAFTLPNVLRAANDVKYTMTVSIVSMWIFRIILAFILGWYTDLGVYSVWIAMYVDWVVRSFFFVLRYRGKKWEKQVI